MLQAEVRSLGERIELEKRRSIAIIWLASMGLAVDLAGLAMDFIPPLQKYAVIFESLTLFFILPALRIRGGWPAVGACLSAYLAAFNLDLALNRVLGMEVPGLRSLTFILPNAIVAAASMMIVLASLAARRGTKHKPRQIAETATRP